MFRKALIEIMDNDLLNEFVNSVFGYRLAQTEYVYIQYKIVQENIVLNIFDNGKKNRFKAFIFSLANIESDDEAIYINVHECYDLYKKRKTKRKLYLIGALLYSNDNKEKKEIIESLSNNVHIKYILYKNFIL